MTLVPSSATRVRASVAAVSFVAAVAVFVGGSSSGCATTAATGGPSLDVLDVLVVDLRASEADSVAAVALTGAVAAAAERIPDVSVTSVDEVRTLVDVAAQQQLAGEEPDLAVVGRLLGKRLVVGGRVAAVGELAILQLFVIDTASATVLARESARVRGPTSELFPRVADVVTDAVTHARARLASPEAVVDDIAVTVRESQGFLQWCYERELLTNAELSGRLVVRFDVDEAGRAVTIAIDEEKSTLDSTAMASCLTATARVWRFPAAAAGATIEIPFVFDVAPSPPPALPTPSPSSTVAR